MSTNHGLEERRPTSGGSMFLHGSNRFPEDLRAWIRGPALVRLAHRVAQEHTAAGLCAIFSFSAKRFHHPWRLLALLTYAYGTGIWHSRAIAELAALDPHLVALCHGEPPSMELIRRFRNHNREAIVRALEQLIRRLWSHRFERHLTAVPSLLIAEILCNARMRLQRAERCEREDSSAETEDFQGGK